MNLLAKRREAGAICRACRSPGYTAEPPHAYYIKPVFRCTSCGHSWSSGRDGGVYAQFADKTTQPNNQEVIRE